MRGSEILSMKEIPPVCAIIRSSRCACRTVNQSVMYIFIHHEMARMIVQT